MAAPKPAASPPAAVAGDLGSLPLTLVPATGAGDTLAVFYSGDGGWAAADQGITEVMAKAGIPVLGVNSLRYFMTRKTPEGAAADLTAVLRHYMALWGKSRIILAGYSFGAGAIPLIEPHLPADLRTRVRLVALVDPEKAGELKFWPGDWFNMAGAGSQPIGPALVAMKGLPTVCIYGAAEAGAACAGVPAAVAKSVAVPGGHHLGGDYGRVGQTILDSLPK